MASKKVDVAVYHHGVAVGTLTARPVRMMPNARAGVVRDGVVYPPFSARVVQL